MNLASIVLVLQLALSLLVSIQSNPAAGQEEKQRALTFANSAIGIAVQAIQAQSNAQTTSSTASNAANSSKSVIPPKPTNCPDCVWNMRMWAWEPQPSIPSPTTASAPPVIQNSTATVTIAPSNAVLNPITRVIVSSKGTNENESVRYGMTDVLIGDFVLTASSNEDILLKKIGLTVNPDFMKQIRNLRVMVGSAQFGATKADLPIKIKTDPNPCDYDQQSGTVVCGTGEIKFEDADENGINIPAGQQPVILSIRTGIKYSDSRISECRATTGSWWLRQECVRGLGYEFDEHNDPVRNVLAPPQKYENAVTLTSCRGITKISRQAVNCENVSPSGKTIIFSN